MRAFSEAERAPAGTAGAGRARVRADGLQLLADGLVDLEVLGDAAVDADRLALGEVRLGVPPGHALGVARPARA
jgi:hypothetical protein